VGYAASMGTASARHGTERPRSSIETRGDSLRIGSEETAVYRDGATGDVAGVRGYEENHRRGDFR
jgi:hypothetical protein